MWDITAGGHVLKGEFGYEAIIRETKEEVGINLNAKDLLFIGSTLSINTKDDIINKHFNEFYIAHKDIDLQDITLDESEVAEVKYVTKEELLNLINNNYENLTSKKNCWDYLKKYLENQILINE